MTSKSNRYLGYWTLFVALSISTVAAYYSIVGLAVIFAAALIPVIIMGTVLEIAKITTAIWLHANWDRSPLLIKTYLTSATVVLMFITSMGIYGFLSKAHIEQNAVGLETQAKLEQLDKNILAAETAIDKIAQDIMANSQRESTLTADIQSQIDREQSRIDQAIARTQPAIDEQQAIIDKEQANRDLALAPVTSEMSRIETLLVQLASERTSLISAPNVGDSLLLREELKLLEDQQAKFMNMLTFSNKDSIVELQNLVGTTADGRIGADTRSAIDAYRSRLDQSITDIKLKITDAEARQVDETRKKETRISTIDKDIIQLRTELRELKSKYEVELKSQPESTTKALQEISRIRAQLESQIKNSHSLINNLRLRLENFDNFEIKNELMILEKDRQTRQSTVDVLYQEKFSVESSIRKLEAEIGPVKYIAELIYGNSADKYLLETAVRWVIILLVLVFDPLAIVLVIAGLFMLTARNQVLSPTTLPHANESILHTGSVIDLSKIVEPKVRKPRRSKLNTMPRDKIPTESENMRSNTASTINSTTTSKTDTVELALAYDTPVNSTLTEIPQIKATPATNTIIVRKPK